MGSTSRGAEISTPAIGPATVGLRGLELFFASHATRSNIKAAATAARSFNFMVTLDIQRAGRRGTAGKPRKSHYRLLCATPLRTSGAENRREPGRIRTPRLAETSTAAKRTELAHDTGARSGIILSGETWGRIKPSPLHHDEVRRLKRQAERDASRVPGRRW